MKECALKLLAFLHSQFPVLFLKTKEIPEEKKKNVRDAYAFLETFLEGNDYLAGNHYTIADMCCIATVSSMVVSSIAYYISLFPFFKLKFFMILQLLKCSATWY